MSCGIYTVQAGYSNKIFYRVILKEYNSGSTRRGGSRCLCSIQCRRKYTVVQDKGTADFIVGVERAVDVNVQSLLNEILYVRIGQTRPLTGRCIARTENDSS